MRRWMAMLLTSAVCLHCTFAVCTPPERIIHVDVEKKVLTLFEGETILMQCTVATGAWDTPTPVGIFTITHRFSGQMGGFGTCFLGLDVPWGNYGIHGTNKPESIGYNASHGCIRMYVDEAERLYRLAPNGTKVVIECGPYGDLGYTLRLLKNGDRSQSVRAVQMRLRSLGFYHGQADGVFGQATQAAVDRARTTYSLTPNGLVDWALYQKLGITLFE